MRARIALSFLILCLLPTALSSALPEPDPPVRYALLPEAVYEEGCFEPCMCPILLATDVEGAFALDAIDPEGAWNVYAVSEVAWDVIFFGEPFRRAVGEGIYRVDPAAKLQQMVLELQIDGAEAVRFDSGLVPIEVEWPALALAVSRNGMFCYDEVYYVRAAPAGPISLDPPARWGALKARW